jgi:hypothetical protein
MAESVREFEQELQTSLVGLSQQSRVAFAAAICDLMLPGVGGPWGATIGGVLRHGIELCWSSALGGPPDGSEVRRALAGVEAMASSDHDPYSLQSAANDFVVFAVAYALDATVADSVQNAVWCARQLIELADLVEAEGLDAAGSEDELFAVVTATIRSVVDMVWLEDLLPVRASLVVEGDRIARLVLDRIPRVEH